MLDEWWTHNVTLNVLLGITSPPEAAIQGNDAHGEDEETQRHGLPPAQSIDGPQCHQQSYATV